MKSEAALQRLREDPVAFSRVVLNFEPWKYQEAILRDMNVRLVGVCGRQVGKSTISAVRAIWFASTHPNTTTIIVSATLRQSMETFEKVGGFVNSSIVSSSVTRRTLTQIYLSNGARIICLPSGRTGHTLHGLTVHFAIIDEAAMVSDMVISEAVFPMLLTTKGTIWMMTTPLDKAHVTYKCFINPTWSHYHFPSTISPLVTKEFCDDYRTVNGEDAYRRQILAEFADDADSYFPMSLLRENIEGRLLTMPEMKAIDAVWCAGLDPGGKLSYAATVVGGKFNKQRKIHVTFYNVTKQMSDEDTIYTRQVAETNDLHKVLRFYKVTVDQTGLGNPIVEHAKQLALPVTGLMLGQRTKEEIFSNLRILLENHEIDIPDDPELLLQLNAVKYARTRGGGYSFEKREGSYDDLAFATALMAWGFKNTGSVIKLGVKK